MSNVIQTIEELDAVLRWRNKHAVAIKERDALQQRLNAADQRIDELERYKVRIDWLAEQPVDTLYLDDGRIIDIAGRVDLRDAIDAAIAKHVESDPNDDCVSDGGTCGLGGHCSECPHTDLDPKIIGIERMPPMEYDEP